MRRVAVALAALALLSLGAGPSPAAAQECPGGSGCALVIESFDSHMEVQPDASVIVTERIRPRFTGSWNGLQRDFVLNNLTAAGRPVVMGMELIAATVDGQAARHEMDRTGQATRRLRVWVPDARNRAADVVIRYRLTDGAIRYFAADTAAGGIDRPYDELYLQVTGTESQVPIQRASVTVALPGGAQPIQAAAYSGGWRSTDQVEARVVSGGVEVPPVGPLSPGQGLTVAVDFERGVVAQPQAVSRSPQVQLNQVGPAPLDGPIGTPAWWAFLPVLLPFLAFWFAHKAWEKRGRDPKGRAITVHWEPPEGLTPAEAGTLVDHSPDMHDVISILVDLAVRGYVEIEEREGGFLGFGKDYAFHLMRPRTEWGELTRYESLFLKSLFRFSSSDVLAGIRGSGGILGGIVSAVSGSDARDGAPAGAVDSVLLSELKNKFYKDLPPIKNDLLDTLVEKGYYRNRPDHVRGIWIAMSVGTVVVGLMGLFAAGAGTASAMVLGGTLAFAGVASGVVLMVFAFLMPARTELGARTREAALGFKQFLERVESPRYRRMITSPDQFEKYLPFAMAFKCEEEWAKAFDDMLTEPPDWYHGRHGAFHASVFASDLSGMASAAGTAMSTAPGSSSGGGGGGSVGGGGGGGGVGGF